MNALVVIIGDNFVGGINLYNTTIRALKTKKIKVSPIAIVSSKKIIGIDDAIISPNLATMLKDEFWMYTVPGQPGLYAINPTVYNGVGIMTIPARGKDTAELLEKIHTEYPLLHIVPVVLIPQTLNGALATLTNDYKLSDDIATKIYTAYNDNPEWREDIVPEDLADNKVEIHYPRPSSLINTMWSRSIISVVEKLDAKNENSDESEN